MMRCLLHLLFTFFTFSLYHCLSSTIHEENQKVEIVEKSFKPKQRSVTGRLVTGNDCEYIKLCSVTSSDECTDKGKHEIKQEKGVRKQFLILNGETIMGFVRNWKKFADCESYTKITTKAVRGLIDVDLDSIVPRKFEAARRRWKKIQLKSRLQRIRKSLALRLDQQNLIQEKENVDKERSATIRKVTKGNNCEYIRLYSVFSDGVDCMNGHKFVLKGTPVGRGVRRQFLLLQNEVILAFLRKKITDCDFYTDITDRVECSAVSTLFTEGNLVTVDLDTQYAIYFGIGKQVNPSDFSDLECFLPNLPEINLQCKGYFAHCTVSAVVDGYVMSCGGGENFSEKSRKCHALLDGGWQDMPSMIYGRSNAAVSPYPGGGIIVTGGDTYNPSTTEIFVNGVWTQGVKLERPTSEHCQVTIGTTIIITGNGKDNWIDQGAGPIGREVYKLEAGATKWERLPDMTKRRSSHGCAVLNDYVYVLGSEWDGEQFVERYKLGQSAWEPVADLPITSFDTQLDSPQNAGQAIVINSILYAIRNDGRVYSLENDNLPIEYQSWKEIRDLWGLNPSGTPQNQVLFVEQAKLGC